MAAGTIIKLKRKAGAFLAGELQAGEFGLDVTNVELYGSVDGTSVFSITPGGGDALQSLTLAQFAATTSEQLRGVISDETGTGALVFATSPTLVTPTLGVASATSVNKVAITQPATAATLTLADNSTLATVGAFALTLTLTGATAITLPTSGTLATEAYVNNAVAGLLDYKGSYNATTNSPDLDVSPSGILKGDSYTVTGAGNFFSTAVEVGDFIIANQDNPTLVAHWTVVQKNMDGIAVTGSTLAQFAATTSAQLAGVITDETGSGALVFANSPTLTTPVIAQITNTGTLTLPTSTDTLVGRATTDTLTNKTLSSSTNVIDGGTI
jgi:hypothetical protein